MKHEENFTPFYRAFLRLCESRGMSPSAAAKMAGISSGAPTAWKNNGSIPKPEQRNLLCKLFGVTDLELMGYEPMTLVPTERSTRGMTPEEREAHYRGLHLAEKKEKPAEIGELSKDEIEYIKWLREAPDNVKEAVKLILKGEN